MGHDQGADACRHSTERSCNTTARGHRMALVREELSLHPVLNMCVRAARKMESSVTDDRATWHPGNAVTNTGAGSSNSRSAGAGFQGATLTQVWLKECSSCAQVLSTDLPSSPPPAPVRLLPEPTARARAHLSPFGKLVQQTASNFPVGRADLSSP